MELESEVKQENVLSYSRNTLKNRGKIRAKLVTKLHIMRNCTIGMKDAGCRRTFQTPSTLIAQEA
jgi:hypothetical protein